ncbi:MAG: hypothetical protein KDD82_27210, partial [Planctomycetes bacterium]|nr:hypothetical protein [Planctomycetota bacterium]
MKHPSPARRWLTRSRLAAPLAGLAGLAVAWPCVRLGWVGYDEDVYARDNLYLLDLRDAWTLITSPGPSYQFQPTTYLAHAVDYALFGDSVAWFHAVNVLLYGVCCLLVARLGQALLADWGWGRAAAARAGFLGGLCFAVHPVHVECYAWLGDRKDLLACALGVWSYLVYRRIPAASDARRRLGAHLLAGGLLVAALGAKLSAAPLGGCLALEGLLGARGGVKARLWRALRFGGPALVIGAVCSLGWYALQAQYPLPLSRPSPGHGAVERALYVLRCYGHYVKLLGWPADLAVHYYPRPTWWEWGVCLGWLLAGVGAVALAARDRALRPLAAWACGWFVMGLVLVSNVVLLGYVNDRYLLLPSAGVACLGGAWLARGGRGRLALGVGLALTWTWRSAAQIPTWTSPRTLWTQVLRVDPQHPYALARLGQLE